jgi:nanoRNase/pAp phosphatase (c-di-AMP/oligoRNAs hydrolase)
MRSPDSIKITGMRNPWLPFPSIYLGKLFERFGGGGHRRVGSLLLRGADVQKADDVLKRLLNEIRIAESNKKKRVAA